MNQVSEVSAEYLVVGELVPVGYKKTEVGVIPKDWNVRRLKEISPSQSVGLVINPSSYFSERGTIPMLVGSHVSENSINWERANRITAESNSRLPASRLKAGDLVMVRVGEPGVAAVVPPSLDGSNCASMMIVRQGNCFDSTWLCFVMNSSIGRNQVEGVRYGTAQKQFNIIDAIEFKYPFPDLKEQTAIANALSDVDALIASLEKLIAKKQAIKTATMQQLLTGKTRLPQFTLRADGTPKGTKNSELGEIPEDWDVSSVGSFDPFVTSGSRGWAAFYSSYGDPFVRITNLSRGSIYLDMSDTKYVSVGAKSSEGKRTQLENGDLLVSITADIGIIGYVDDLLEKPAYINQHIALLRFSKDRIDSKFLAYFMAGERIQRLFRGGADQGAKAGMNLQGVRSILVIAPSKQEQRHIASILSDIDSELKNLQKRLSKTRQLKQGMMQQLLTGKIRLVKPARGDG